MGPVEANLVHKYDKVRRKFYPAPPPHLPKPKPLEQNLLQLMQIEQQHHVLLLEHANLEKRVKLLERLSSPDPTCPHIPQTKTITVHNIILLVCAGEGVRRAEVVGQQRNRTIVWARHLICYLSASLTYCSLPQIGRCLGNRDHTTILHGKRKITRLRALEPELDAKLKRYEDDLLASIDPTV